jgi:hypothetical protein
MADNFPVTPGAGRNVATDQVTYSGDTADLQLIRLVGATGSEGSKTVVEPVSGEVFLGQVGGRSRVITASFNRPADTTQYAAGDAVSDSTSSPTQITFNGAARINDGSGVIVNATLIDSVNAASDGVFELWLFDASVTPNNDNSAFAPSDGDAEKAIGVIQFSVAVSGSNNSVYAVTGLSIPFKCSGGVDDIFGLLVVRNAYTPVNAEKFTIRLGILQD